MELTSLARLANDSGGRFTEKTNDLTLGYARAQRDQGCVYSVGFYLRGEVDDRPRNLAVRVRRPGLRAIHPSKYVFRSESARKESLLRAAWVSPEMFQNGVVRAHIFPVRPSSKRAWETMLAVSFPLPRTTGPGDEIKREFGAVLRDGPRVAHRFDRTITIRNNDHEVDAEPLITFLEGVELEPGSYTLTTVLAGSEGAGPQASRVAITVPEVPRREMLLSGPILGRTAGPNLVVIGGSDPASDAVGDRDSFQPLLVQQLDEPIDLISLTQACMVSKKKREQGKGITIDRALREAHGAEVEGLETVGLALDGDDAVRCQDIVDLLPVSTLGNGEYVFEARIHGGKHPDSHGTVRFAIGAGGGGYGGQSGGSVSSRGSTSE